MLIIFILRNCYVRQLLHNSNSPNEKPTLIFCYLMFCKTKKNKKKISFTYILIKSINIQKTTQGAEYEKYEKLELEISY